MSVGSNSQSLVLRQGQSLVMTPQLQLSLKILQFSNQELLSYLEQELEKNPLLLKKEEQEFSPDQAELFTKEKNKSDAADEVFKETDSEKATEALDMSRESQWGETEEESATFQQNDYGEEPGFHIKTGSVNQPSDGQTSFYEQIPEREASLKDYILDQINIDFSEQEKIIALHLLDLLDENGYFTADILPIARLLECKESTVENVLNKLQKCDPPGIFARNLSECLELQLKEKNRFDPAMESLLENLDLVAKNNARKLMKICGVNEEDLSDMLKEIRMLNPKPGGSFAREIVQQVEPDIFVRRSNEGGWTLELNSDTLPKMLVNNRYYSEIKKLVKGDYEKKYISQHYSSANWLVKALNQRAETILKVATEIVKQQEEFFEKGIYYLHPLILRNIAEKLEIHESTVARVTTNKYMATPRGLYELKFFFSSAIHSSSGEEDYSSKTVKHLIKKLIDNEAVDNILSDDTLAEILKNKGVDVARRTVAKYRESMRIPSSFQRKQQKRNHI